MKLAGITRVRNESEIISATLDHVAEFCEEIFVFDDASEDNTAELCKLHPAVSEVFVNSHWASDPQERKRMEATGRQIPYDAALESGADYIYLFDADEHAEITNWEFTHDHYPLRLFAFYITEEDKEKGWQSRRWMGPEYQDIPMIWRAIPRRFYERAATNGPNDCGPVKGYVKHFGKAMSVEQWDRDCEYYSQNRWMGINESLRRRWENRRGQAVHSRSDFGAALITWDERNGRHITELKE